MDKKYDVSFLMRLKLRVLGTVLGAVQFYMVNKNATF